MANTLACFGRVFTGGNRIMEVVGFSVDTTVNQVDDMELSDKFMTVNRDVTSVGGSIDTLLDRDDGLGQGALLVGDTVQIQLLPEGAGGGNVQLSFNALIDSVGIANARGAMVTRKYAFTSIGMVDASTLPPVFGDIGTASIAEPLFDPSLTFPATSTWVSGDGANFFIAFAAGSGNASVARYNMPVPFMLDTMTQVSVTEIPTTLASGGVSLSADGSRLYMGEPPPPSRNRQYDLPTPFDPSTFSNLVTVTSGVPIVSGQVSMDGGMQYQHSGAATGSVIQRNLLSANDYTGMAASGDLVLSLTPIVPAIYTSTPNSFVNNGSIYVLATGGGLSSVLQLSMSDPNDVTTAVLSGGTGTPLDISAESPIPTSISTDYSGEHIYIVNDSGEINHYTTTGA